MTKKATGIKTKKTGLATLRAVGGVPVALTMVCLKNKPIPQNISINMAVWLQQLFCGSPSSWQQKGTGTNK